VGRRIACNEATFGSTRAARTGIVPPDMAEPSIPPAGVPDSDNTKYGIVALVLLLGTCGLVAWKMKGDSPTTTSVPTVTAPTALPPITRRDEPEAPPPPDPVATVKATGNGTAVANNGGGGGPSGCTPKCTGSAGDDLVGALAQRGRMARRCYERELANDPKLSMRMTMNVRVGSNGSTCSATPSGESGSIGACVANFYRTGGFPPAKGGCAEVNVPLNFVPGK
jgi:hypothetical protein